MLEHGLKLLVGCLVILMLCLAGLLVAVLMFVLSKIPVLVGIVILVAVAYFIGHSMFVEDY